MPHLDVLEGFVPDGVLLLWAVAWHRQDVVDVVENPLLCSWDWECFVNICTTQDIWSFHIKGLLCNFDANKQAFVEIHLTFIK